MRKVFVYSTLVCVSIVWLYCEVKTVLVEVVYCRLLLLHCAATAVIFTTVCICVCVFESVFRITVD